MRIESKLCHLSDNKAVVHVRGWLNEKNVGSALAEATTVELAEDKAISRLNKRLNVLDNNETEEKSNIESKNRTHIDVELPKSENLEAFNSVNEPSDWSNELTSIDTEIQRLNWTREDEVKFLEQNFGYNNRNRITKYKELVKYLNQLKKIDNSNTSSLKTNNINNMINESDVILSQLSWNHKQGREFLQREFNVSTRKELNEEQLISFLNKLKSIRNQYLQK